jgi:hypothetical protein
VARIFQYVQRYFSDNEQAKRFADEILLDRMPEEVGSLLDGKFGFEVSERTQHVVAQLLNQSV